MIARQYNRRISLYTTFDEPDGYGGNDISVSFIQDVWAEVKQLSSFRDNTTGISDIRKNYSFKIRNFEALDTYENNLFIIYQGNEYIVNDFSYADELRREVNLIANQK